MTRLQVVSGWLAFALAVLALVLALSGCRAVPVPTFEPAPPAHHPSAPAQLAPTPDR